MERRSFFKILSTVSAGVAASSCSRDRSDALIPVLVPDHEIVPGEEQWHPAICGQCSAGCGTIVRVMEGERTIERGGRKFRERLASIKKIEGNPLDPVSGGRLCARGQAAVQSLYNPDRITGPMRRKGARGSAEFTPASWDEAIAAVANALAKQRSTDPNKILFLARPEAGSRTLAIQRFLSAMNAAPPLTCSLADLALERRAAGAVLGWKGVPVYDIAQARYVLGVGADFLGGWASPVYYARQYGAFRQGRPGTRGRLVQAESRMSLTAASADEWLPLQPGSEPQFVTALSRLLIDIKSGADLQQLPPAWVDAIRSANVSSLSRRCGVETRRIERIARELGESEAPLVMAGASYLHTNSLAALNGAHYLNLILGVVGKPGGVLPPNEELSPRPEGGNIASKLAVCKLLLLDGENPVYSLPASAGVQQALMSLEMIVSLTPFLNDSAAYADWILPDHHTLECASAVVPTVSPRTAITVSAPFVEPLYDTRAVEQTLADIARKAGAEFEAVTAESYVKPFLTADETWAQVARQGGLWRDEMHNVAIVSPRGDQTQPPNAGAQDAIFQGEANQFPLYFQPYLSLQYHDGSGANLPWMQELPDPSSSAMWSIPIELDVQTAARLNVNTGDWVRVESQVSALEAPAYVHPAAVPGVASMAIGDGHAHYGRYASGRGANPISILASVWEPSTGRLALGATRVRITRIDRKTGGLIQFSPRDREQGPWGYR